MSETLGKVENKRSILENPKTGKAITIEQNVKDGIVSKFWRKRLIDFYGSMIPSHVSKKNQIWLTSTKEVAEFIEKLKDPDFDLFQIQYVCILRTISVVYDIVDFFCRLRGRLPDNARIIYANYNWKFELIFKITGLLGISRKNSWGNFYRDGDLDCFLDMAGWENVKKINKFVLPIKIKWIGDFIDDLFRLPLLRGFTLNTIFIARKKSPLMVKEHSTTVLIPCKNEEENIEAIVKRMPTFGASVEIIFINDKSTDTTEEKISFFKERYKEKNIKLVQGAGRGKGEAIREGMKYATGDICMILDADLSLIPEDLPQFYQAINSGRADFINGTRLVYPQEHGAMKIANLLGNIGFSLIFSYILDQRITDTLCGTKVFWKRDWSVFEETRQILNNVDVWGDYNLIFGASRFGLKIGELPVRYFQRLEGVTKMTKRLLNGLIMLRVAWHALLKIKFVSEESNRS